MTDMELQLSEMIAETEEMSSQIYILERLVSIPEKMTGR